MKIRIHEHSVAAKMLFFVGAAESVLNVAFLPPHKWRMLEWCPHYGTYKSTIYRMIRSGFIEIVEGEDTRLLKLTAAGQMQLFLLKARIAAPPEKWDGKWRLVLFDIPEDAHRARNQLRRLLSTHGFKKLQHSVYISPQPLNRDAVEFLREEGLDEYIRVMRVDDMDNEAELLKKFHLKRPH